MKSELSHKLKLITDHSHPGIRDEVAAHLAACQFSDDDDPTLNALVVQALIAGQPVRASDAGGALLATEAGLARLGDRFSEIAWGLARTKLLNVFLACVLSALVTGGAVVLSMRHWQSPKSMAAERQGKWDERIRSLEKIGADLRVLEKDRRVYVYCLGAIQPAPGKTEKGISYLCFTP